MSSESVNVSKISGNKKLTKKAESAKKEELPPLPDVGIKSLEPLGKENKNQGKKDLQTKNNITKGNDSNDKKYKEFKMDTSFLDID